jgi:pimeloyl-ACP methyl ester carboxylesterase
MNALVLKKSTIVRKMIEIASVRASFALGGLIAPRATALRAARLFGTPFGRGRERARTAADAGAQRSWIDVGDVRLALYVWGDPSTQPYVLLAHGWSSYALRFMSWVQALRAEGYAVVAFDQRGHGRSEGDLATLPDFVSGIDAVGRRFGKAAAVIGHSFGGAAAAIALRDGLRADRCVLLAPAADLDAATSRFARFIGLGERLRLRMNRVLESWTSIVIADVQAHLDVATIGTPALIVHDLEDRDVPWSEGERYARYWPDARLMTTQKLGHDRVLDDHGVIAAALRFMRGEIVGERVVSTPNLPFGIA